MRLLSLTEVHLQPNVLNNCKLCNTSNVSLFFTISDFTGINCFYKSSICNDSKNPSWSCADLYSLNEEFSHLQSVYFQFFVSTSSRDQNEIVLKAAIRLPLLQKLGSVFPTEMLISDPCDRIIFRVDKEYLTWTQKSDTSMLRMKSYDVAQIKRIITLEKKLSLNRTRFSEVYKQFSVFHQTSGGTVFKHKDSTQTHQEISVLRARIKETKQCLTKLKSRVEFAKQEVVIANDKKRILENAACVCSKKLDRTAENVIDSRTSVTKILQILNLRKYYMISELCGIFPIDVVGGNLKNNSYTSSDSRMTICNTLLMGSDAPGTSSTVVASFVDVGDGLAPNPHPSMNDNGEEQTTQPPVTTNSDSSGIIRLTQSARSPLLANKPYTASVGLGHVAAFLRLLSLILNTPLRYPILPPVGSYRARIVDSIIPHLAETERSFPLYMQRNVALPTFRYAVFLLNRDIAILRGFFGLNTMNARASLWNLKHLLDARLLHVDLRYQQQPFRPSLVLPPQTSKESNEKNDCILIPTIKVNSSLETHCPKPV